MLTLEGKPTIVGIRSYRSDYRLPAHGSHCSDSLLDLGIYLDWLLIGDSVDAGWVVPGLGWSDLPLPKANAHGKSRFDLLSFGIIDSI